MEVLDASPAVHPILYGYDSRGRLSTMTQGEHRLRTVYRSDGRVESTVFEQASGGGWVTLATHGTSYDSNRRPSAMSLPGGVEIGLSVDRMHQLTALTPPSRSAHTMGYDGEGRMNAFSSPAAVQPGSPMTLGWHYNARRQLDQFTRADNSTVSMTFDPTTTALTDVTVPGLGVLHRARRPLTGATDYVDAPNGCRERISYEFEGEVSPSGVTLESVPGQTCPVTGAVNVGRNALGEGTSLTVAGTPAVAFTVDSDPDRLLTNAGGMALTPDPATGRLTGTSVGLVITGQTYTAYGTPATLTSTVNGTLHHGFAYTPDAMGRIATITETGETPRVTTYAYDSAGRLWQVWRDGTQVAQYEHLGTDGANGNRTAWTAGGRIFTASYDGQDRLTGYTDNGTATTLGYDAHGNVQTRTTGADVTTYTWDPRGPLASVQRPGGAALIEYVLDPAGRRIGRKVGGALERGWLYAGGLLPVAETDADGHTVRRVFVYATRPNVPDLVQQLEGGAWVTYRVLVDHLGSVRSVVRASDGAVVQRMDYDAFGVVLDDWSASGWVRLPFGFAGGLYDRETGLVRFGAREYDARVGRWISRDPALFGGGDSNLYRYCAGEPVNFIDVDGRNPWLFWLAFAYIIADARDTGGFRNEYAMPLGVPHSSTETPSSGGAEVCHGPSTEGLLRATGNHHTWVRTASMAYGFTQGGAYDTPDEDDTRGVLQPENGRAGVCFAAMGVSAACVEQRLQSDAQSIRSISGRIPGFQMWELDNNCGDYARSVINNCADTAR